RLRHATPARRTGMARVDRGIPFSAVLALVLSVLAAIPRETTAGTSEASGPAPPAVAYGWLPLHFEPNRGQTAEHVKFLARGAGYGLFLAPGEVVLVLA